MIFFPSLKPTSHFNEPALTGNPLLHLKLVKCLQSPFAIFTYLTPLVHLQKKKLILPLSFFKRYQRTYIQTNTVHISMKTASNVRASYYIVTTQHFTEYKVHLSFRTIPTPQSLSQHPGYRWSNLPTLPDILESQLSCSSPSTFCLPPSMVLNGIT